MAHLLRFDRDFSRRAFLDATGKGLLRAGVFGSAWTAFLQIGRAHV
jgi:hypothetical protein